MVTLRLSTISVIVRLRHIFTLEARNGELVHPRHLRRVLQHLGVLYLSAVAVCSPRGPHPSVTFSRSQRPAKNFIISLFHMLVDTTASLCVYYYISNVHDVLKIYNLRVIYIAHSMIVIVCVDICTYGFNGISVYVIVVKPLPRAYHFIIHFHFSQLYQASANSSKLA